MVTKKYKGMVFTLGEGLWGAPVLISGWDSEDPERRFLVPGALAFALYHGYARPKSPKVAERDMLDFLAQPRTLGDILSLFEGDRDAALEMLTQLAKEGKVQAEPCASLLPNKLTAVWFSTKGAAPSHPEVVTAQRVLDFLKGSQEPKTMSSILSHFGKSCANEVERALTQLVREKRVRAQLAKAPPLGLSTVWCVVEENPPYQVTQTADAPPKLLGTPRNNVSVRALRYSAIYLLGDYKVRVGVERPSDMYPDTCAFLAVVELWAGSHWEKLWELAPEEMTSRQVNYAASGDPVRETWFKEDEARLLELAKEVLC